MNIIEALQALKDGKKIQENEWVTALYLELRDGEICFDDLNWREIVGLQWLRECLAQCC